jgi:hypothetical protein
MNEKLTEGVGDFGQPFDGLEAFIREEGIATRRHMDVVIARIRAEIRVILERHHLRETTPPASEEGRGPADPATSKLADR